MLQNVGRSVSERLESQSEYYGNRKNKKTKIVPISCDSDECGSREEPKKNVENRFTFTEKYMDALFLL